jgi:hypothetical protein
LVSSNCNEYQLKIVESVEQTMAPIDVGFEYVTAKMERSCSRSESNGKRLWNL